MSPFATPPWAGLDHPARPRPAHAIRLLVLLLALIAAGASPASTGATTRAAGDTTPLATTLDLSPSTLSTPNLSTSPAQVAANGTLTVTWSNFTPTGNDWISMHPAGAPDTDYVTWKPINNVASPTTFSAPANGGTFEIRLFANGTRVATSNAFAVPVLSASPVQLAPWQPVSVGWSNFTPTGNDWISVHPQGAPDTDYLGWKSINNVTSPISFYAPTQPGDYEYRLFANGTRVATSNVVHVVSGATPTNDIVVTALEITQGIQDLHNNMPLVQDRQTMARVYLGPTSLNLAGLHARLRAFRNGVEVTAALLPLNTISTSLPNGSVRLNLDDTFYFYIPPILRSGTITFRAEVDYDNTIPRAATTNNVLQQTVTFHKGQNLNLTMVPLHLHNYGNPSNPAEVYTPASDPNFARMIQDIRRYHPVAQVNWQLLPTTLYPGNHGAAQGTEWDLSNPMGRGQLLGSIAAAHTLANEQLKTHWFGMIPPDINTATLHGLSHVGPDPSAWDLWVRLVDNPEGGPYWRIKGSNIAAHELGHNLGLQHVNCGGDEPKPLETGYPWQYPHCSIAAVDPAGYYGFDVYYADWNLPAPTVLSNDPAAPAPHAANPIMGYPGPEWISPWEYCRLLNEDGIPTSWSSNKCNLLSTPTPSSAVNPATSTSATRYLAVSGKISTTSDVATIDTLRQLDTAAPSAPPEQPGATPYTLVQLDSGGKVLSSQVLALDDDAHETGISGAFMASMPLSTGATAIEIRHGTAVLLHRAASANRPVVQLQSPNAGANAAPGTAVQWTASDADGDPLSFDVLYSADAGQHWLPIGVGLTTTSFTLPAGLAGSSQARVRVMASDGFWTTEADSAASFTVAPSPPVVAILQPTANIHVLPGARLVLEGMAMDPQDGGLSGAALIWHSDRDGDLGTGAELPTTLSPGVHHLTLTATDSAGQTATATTTLTVDPYHQIFIPDVVR